MIRAYKITNPCNPGDGVEKTEHEDGCSILDLGDYIDEPWLCIAYIDGKRYCPLRHEWEETKLKDGDFVYFMPHVGESISFFIFALLLVTAVVVALSIIPPTVADTPEPDPVFDLKGQKNQIRLGNPIEDGYGLVRLWPSYATRPYNQFYGNDQFQFQLFCLGHGSWDIDAVRIEDTAIDNFQEVTYEIYEPYQQVTLFPDNVETSVEVGQIELLGANEIELPEVLEHTGPFVANSANTLTARLEVDVVLPQGAYSSNDDGGFNPLTVEALFEYRLIDINDDPEVPDGIGETFYVRTIFETRNLQEVGSPWTAISNVFVEQAHTEAHQTVIYGDITPGGPVQARKTEIFYIYEGSGWDILSLFNETFATNTPQRITLSKEVPEGRYEVRAIRTNDASESLRDSDKIQWVGMRAFLASKSVYGDVTMLAIRSRATNNLNDKSSNRVNVVGTRKLPVWDSETKTLGAYDDIENRVATRSHIWAMVNILRNKYGANLADEFIDLEFLADEATQGVSDGIFFDWIYDQRSTVWEDIKLPCFVAKSIPMLNGSRISLVRDKPATLPTFFINPENTVENSFVLEKKLFELRENDGLEIEYTDPDTWKPEIVECLLSGSDGLNLKKLKLQGITDRQRAYDLGMYLWTKETYERSQVKITTGLEGYIPSYGDLGRIGSDVPRWGQSGFVISIDGFNVTLSEPVEFTEGEIHQLAIRGRYGQDLGPYTVTAGATSSEVVLSGSIDSSNIYFDPNSEPPYYLFGVSDRVGTVCRIAKLDPSDSEQVAITAIVDDQRRFTDYGTAPALNQPTKAPVIPDAPVVSSIEVFPIPNITEFVSVLWEPAYGALSYILEQSTDGVIWSQVDNVTRTNYTLPVVPGTLYVRVAAVNIGIGPFVSWSGTVGAATSPPGNVQNLALVDPFIGSYLDFSWNAVASATEYKVKIYRTSDIAIPQVIAPLREITTSALTYIYNAEDANSDGADDRDFTFDVVACNDIGNSETPTALAASNPIPQIVSAGAIQFDDSDSGGAFGTGYETWYLSWSPAIEADHKYFRLWKNNESFTPAPAYLFYQGTEPELYIQIDKNSRGNTPSVYWHVAEIDVWTDEILTTTEYFIEGTQTDLIDDASNDLTNSGNKLIY